MHFSHSGYKWSKSADDRHKAGENNRFPTIFFIKFMRFIKITLFEYPGIGIMKKFASEKMSDHVVAGVT